MSKKQIERTKILPKKFSKMEVGHVCIETKTIVLPMSFVVLLENYSK